MDQELRPSGIDVIGNIPWGTHFCHFYETKQDLLSLQVPYFKAGLENNEYCIWITSKKTSVDEAVISLKEAMADFDKYLERGSIEIMSHREWYIINDKFDQDKLFKTMLDRLRIALDRGFEGLRVNGDETWLNRKRWPSFIDYERALNPFIAGKRLIISCDYHLPECKPEDVLDVALLHESAITKRKGRWEILESPNLKETKAQLNLEKELLEKRVAERTSELIRLTEEVKKERSEREKLALKLKRSQSHLKTLVDTADIALVLFDTNSRVVLFNPIASYWSMLSFGVPLQKDIYFPEMLNEEGRQRFNETMNVALSGQSLNYETSYQQANSSSEWYRVSISPVKDVNEEVIGVCCTASNITRDKLVESEHTRISGQLVQRNQDLDKFAYILSHDLRAPLANMIGLATMLKEDNIPEAERSELDSFLLQSIEKFDDVVFNLNRILQLNRDISLKKEKVDLAELIKEVSSRFKSLNKKDDIRLITNFGGGSEIFSVRGYLHSIFYNLIANSIIYRKPGKPPVIEIRSEKQGEKLFIYFKNYEKNNSPANKKTKTESFQKFDLSDKNNGIGLYTVKSKIEILGGSIAVNTWNGKGAEFRIELPLDSQ